MNKAQNSNAADLNALLDQIAAEAFNYGDRAGDIERMHGWINRGDFDMARRSAQTIIERQRQLRQATENGLPVDLQALLDQIKAEAFNYGDRAGDIERMHGWINRGDFDMACSSANTIIERQRQLRQATANGLPVDLQALLGKIKAEAFSYSDRAGDIERMHDWINRGDFDMALSSAQTIIERQRQLRQATENGLPVDLQALLDQIKAEAFNYGDRSGDIERMHGWINRGDFDMACSSANTIIERQRQLRQATVNGLPVDLQALLGQIKAEAFSYSDRAGDIERMHDWINRGDFDMARSSAQTIIERQRNLKTL